MKLLQIAGRRKQDSRDISEYWKMNQRQQYYPKMITWMVFFYIIDPDMNVVHKGQMISFIG